MDVFLSELIAGAKSIFLGGDYVLLGVVIVVALLVASVIRGAGQLFGASVFAMLLAAFGVGVANVAMGDNPSDPQAYLAGLDGALTGLMQDPGGAMIVGAVVFAVLLVVLMLLKSLVFRG